MQTKPRDLIKDAVRNVLIVIAIYLSILLSGFHDTSRRWTLLICLFGLWGAFLLGLSSTPRVRAASAGNNAVEAETVRRGMASINRAWGAVVLLIIAVGVVLRFSA
jgi:hypothetical protein